MPMKSGVIAHMLCGAATIAFCGGSAMAQTRDAQAARSAEPESDIVVTAQRREERLVDVPISISVQSGEQLEKAGISGTAQLAAVVPGLVFTVGGGFAQPTIRGVSSESTAVGVEQPVAVYLDGAYMAQQSGNIFDLPDIDRIEVLKGPQGTNFGRNATGGAIQIFTREPSFDPKFDVALSDGFYKGGGSTLNAKAFAAGPLSTAVAYSLSGYYSYDNGYLHDDLRNRRTGGTRSAAVRGKLLIEPNDRLSILASGFYQFRDSQTNLNPQPLNGNSIGVAMGFPAPTQPRHVANSDPGFTDTAAAGGRLRINWKVGDGAVTALTAFTRTVESYMLDLDGTPLPGVSYAGHQLDRTFTQEVNYASNQDKPISWTGGLFYIHNLQAYNPGIATIFGAVFPSYSYVTTNGYAGYGEVYVKPIEHLTLIGGLRYSHERKVFEGNVTPARRPIGRASFSAWTPRASAKYELSDQSNLYLSYSNGFKSGAFDSASLSSRIVKPSKVRAFEAGYKYAGHGTTLSLSVYHQKLTDIQVQSIPFGIPVLDNAAAATVIGADVEGSVKLTRTLTLSGGGSWLPRARYDSYPDASVTIPTGVGGNSSGVIDAKGFRLVKTPRFTGNVGLQGNFPMEFGSVNLSTNLYYTGSYAYELTRRVQQKEHVELNASIGVTLAERHLELAVWGKNLTNATYFFSALSSNLADLVTYAPPRQIGLSAKYIY